MWILPTHGASTKSLHSVLGTGGQPARPGRQCTMAIMKDFSHLDERELLALAISLEEEDARIYENFAEGLHAQYPSSAKMFQAMAEEENGHRHRLLDLYRARFGDHIPLVRRHDVKGFLKREPVWLARPLG